MKYFIFIQVFFLFSSIFNGGYAQTQLIDSLKLEIKNAKGDSQKANLLIKLSIEVASRDYKEALKYGKKGLTLAKEHSMTHEEGLAYNNMGIAYWYAGNYDSAQLMYEKSLTKKIETNDSIGIAKCYNNIGLVLWNKGKYAEVLTYFLKGLSTFELLKDSTSLISVYNNIGLVYHELGQIDDALENYLKSWKLNEEIGNSPITPLLTNIGAAYYELKKYDQSEQYHIKSLTESIKNHDKNGMAESYNNLGDIYLDKNNYAEALDFFMRSLALRKETKNIKKQIYSYYKLGLIFYKTEEIEKSKEMLTKSLIIAKDLGNTKDIRNAYLLLAKCFEYQHRYKDAFVYHQLFHQFNDSLYNETSSQQLAEMQTKYETEKKEQEILLLNKDKKIQEVELIKTQDQVKYQKYINYLGVSFTIIVVVVGVLLFYVYRFKKASEKNKLQKRNLDIENKLLRTQLNPHFIFNSLNAIQNFVLKNNSEMATRYLSDFATLMRYILNNSKKMFVELSNELEVVELYLKLEQIRFNQKFSYTINYSKELDIDFILVPPMILQPFLENSIIHGILNKEGKGKIHIDIIEDGNVLCCNIQDDGVGRKRAHIIKNNFIKKSSFSSLGIQINRDRINLLNKELNANGKISIIDLMDDEKKSTGTKVEIILPFKQ